MWFLRNLFRTKRCVDCRYYRPPRICTRVKYDKFMDYVRGIEYCPRWCYHQPDGCFPECKNDLGLCLWFRPRFVYYAHPTAHYNTKHEAECIKTIERLTKLEVINPNGLIPNIDDWMETAKSYIATSDMVAVSTYRTNIIGRGVFMEIAHAFGQKIPVFLLDGNCLVRIKNVTRLNQEDWTEYAQIST